MDFERKFFELYRIRKKLASLFMNLLVQNIATSLFSVFIPVYLLYLGFELSEVILFLIVHYLSIVLFAPFAAVFGSRFGYRDVIIFRMPLYIMYLINLYLLPARSSFIYMIAMLGGVSTIMHAISVNSVFTRHHKIYQEKKTSVEEYVIRFLTALLPLIGAVIAYATDIRMLFVIGIIMILMSALPLFRAKPALPYYKFSLKSRLKPRMLIGFVVEGMHFACIYLAFPVFIYFATKDILLTGMALSAFYLGNMMPLWEMNRSIRIAAIPLLLLWIFRMRLMGLALLLGSFATGAFYMIFHIWMREKTFGERSCGFLLARESGLAAGRLIILVILFFWDFHATFTAVGLSSLYFFAL